MGKNFVDDKKATITTIFQRTQLPRSLQYGYSTYIVDVPERPVMNHVVTTRTDKKYSDLF